MSRMATMARSSVREQFPKLITFTDTDLKRVYTKTKFGDRLVICVKFKEVGNICGPQISRSEYSKSPSAKYRTELSLFFDSHGVILTAQLFEHLGGMIVFDDQQKGMTFMNDWPKELGSIQMFRDGAMIGEKH